MSTILTLSGTPPPEHAGSGHVPPDHRIEITDNLTHQGDPRAISRRRPPRPGARTPGPDSFAHRRRVGPPGRQLANSGGPSRAPAAPAAAAGSAASCQHPVRLGRLWPAVRFPSFTGSPHPARAGPVFGGYYRCGWEAGIRTPIPRSRAACPTIERPPNGPQRLARTASDGQIRPAWGASIRPSASASPPCRLAPPARPLRRCRGSRRRSSGRARRGRRGRPLGPSRSP